LDARSRSGKCVLHAVVAAAALAGATSAGAATKDVQMGPPPSAERSLKALRSEANAFFPATVAVRVGDRVRFVPNGYHTVDLPPRGGGPLAFLVPSGPATDGPDAAGRQFWFRGFELLVVHPKLLSSAGGRTQSYDATRRLNSGLPTNDDYKPLTVRFKRRGSYTYFCNIHQGMTGSVRVLPRTSRAARAADDRKRVSRQLRDAIRTAKRLAGKRTVARLINVGRSGRGGVERFAFSPSASTVPVGTAVTFRVSTGSRVAHTATTGPGSPLQPGSYLGELARSLQGSGVNLAAAYPSEPPTLGAVTLTPRSHGNGFWNSGVMDGMASTPTPNSNRVRFGERGTYRFFCLLHPAMSTVVTVK
jgi:plastocyanin